MCAVASAPGRTASESGRLCRGEGGHQGSDRCRSVLVLPTLRRWRGRYLVASATLSSAVAHASATLRLGPSFPGNVAQPVFITNSVCS